MAKRIGTRTMGERLMERIRNESIQTGEQNQLWSSTESSKLMRRFFVKGMKVLEPIVVLMHGEIILSPVLEKIGRIVEEQGVRTLSFKFLPTFSLY